MLPVIGGMAQGVISVLPPAFISRTRKQLVVAGEPMSLVTFFAFVIFLAAACPAPS